MEGVEKEAKDEKGKIINMKTTTVPNGELGELVQTGIIISLPTLSLNRFMHCPFQRINEK